MRILAVLLPLSFVSIALAQDLPAGKGKDRVEMVCGGCHSLEGVMQMNSPKSGWMDVIEDMKGRGADASDEDFKNIANYLAKYFGPVIQVNKTTTKELQDEFELSPEEAAALVKYRDSKGSIKDWADLAKAPGVDAKKLEPMKKRFKF